MADLDGGTPDERALLANVSQTLTTALDVLTHLEGALIRSGFSDGAAAYGSMCDVLLGQRLWSLSRATPQVQAQFAEVGAKAAAIYRILVPYTDMMRRLSALETLESAFIPAEPPQPLEEAMVQVLSARRTPIDLYALQRATRVDGRAAKKAIAALVDRGVVDSRVVGGRTKYALAEKKPPGTAPPS